MLTRFGFQFTISYAVIKGNITEFVGGVVADFFLIDGSIIRMEIYC